MSGKDKAPKVLIIDDERSNIAFLLRMLKSDYRVVAALNGAEGLAMAASPLPPDLILLDLLMPDMDGYEVCKRLKADERTRGIPIIFVTAVSEVAEEARAFSLGAVDYITKPFHPLVVRARVKTHVDLKRKTDLLERLASLDGLTSISNRRRFDQILELEYARATRTLSALSLILIDVDHFKPYNDHYGHAAGDACLRQVAAILQDCLRRPSDFLARYGGEEFAVLLPGTPIPGASEVAEEMRASVALERIPHTASPVADWITISAGVAAVHAERPLPSPLDLVEAADAMLFQSKREGRNRVTVDVGKGRETPLQLTTAER